MFAALPDPPVRDDGSCAVCGKPRDTGRSRRYARREAERDPFCSVECARAFHGTQLGWPSKPGPKPPESRDANRRDQA